MNGNGFSLALHKKHGDRLKSARELSGLTQEALARRLGYSSNASISKAESGDNPLPIDKLAKAAELLEVSTDWLLGLTGDRTPPHLRSLMADIDAPEPSIDLSDYVAIKPGRIAALAGSAEPGTVAIPDPVTTKPLFFSRDRMHENNMDPEQADVVLVVGDSMHPTLPDGCLVLVDLLRKTPIQDCVFVLTCCGRLVLKRAKRDAAGAWWWASDNPNYEPYTWEPDNMPVTGQVRWSMRRFGDDGH